MTFDKNNRIFEYSKLNWSCSTVPPNEPDTVFFANLNSKSIPVKKI